MVRRALRGGTRRRRADRPDAVLLRSPYAPARVARENPDARIIVCLRHPVERAFSHYWHEKKKRRYDFDFAELLENYDLWSNWLESGFYSRFLERWLDHFPRESLLVQRFDDLHRSPREFLDAILTFIGLEPGFEPTVMHKRVNPARPPEPLSKVRTKRALDRVGLLRVAIGVKGALRAAGLVRDDAAGNGVVRGPMERLADVDSEVVDQLEAACGPEIDRLERLSGVDLRSWRRDG